MKDLKTDSAAQLKVKETIVVDKEPSEVEVASAVCVEKTYPEPAPDLGARYDVLDFVGSGGMGTVWKVYDKELKETFAIKVLKPELLSDDVSMKRFQQEARLATDLTHANIAAIFGPGEDTKGRPYIIMRYVEGESLAQLIERTGPLDPDRAMELFWQINDALAHSHLKGIVHRDIKPSNIIISRTESGGEIAQLVDFGISSSVHEKAGRDQTLTQTGNVLGSPRYMSPEQFLGQDVGPESDMYSLGCVLYEMLTGAPPFTDPNPVKLIIEQINQPPDLLYIPNHLRILVSALLEKTPKLRMAAVDRVWLRPKTIASSLEDGLYAKYFGAAIPLFLSTATIIGYHCNQEIGIALLVTAVCVPPISLVCQNLLLKGQLLPSKTQIETYEASKLATGAGICMLLVARILSILHCSHFSLIAVPITLFIVSRIDRFPETEKYLLKAKDGKLLSKDEIDLQKSAALKRMYDFYVTSLWFSPLLVALLVLPMSFPLLILGLDSFAGQIVAVPILLVVLSSVLPCAHTYSALEQLSENSLSNPIPFTLTRKGILRGTVLTFTTLAVGYLMLFITLPRDFELARATIFVHNPQIHIKKMESAAENFPHSEMADLARLQLSNQAIKRDFGTQQAMTLCQQIVEDNNNASDEMKGFAYANLAYLSKGSDSRIFANKSISLLSKSASNRFEHPMATLLRLGTAGKHYSFKMLNSVLNRPEDLSALKDLYAYIKKTDLLSEVFNDQETENLFVKKLTALSIAPSTPEKSNPVESSKPTADTTNK